MTILITGGLGFIGSALSTRLIEMGHDITVIGRSPQPKPGAPEQLKYISADTSLEGVWQEEIEKNEAIFNLAGESIFCRWNKKTKKKIYDSRILTTRNIVKVIRKDQILINASAVGYYGFHEDEELTENDAPGNDFLASVCKDWEAEAEKGSLKSARVVLTRFGIVLGKSGGALGQMVPAFKWFMGGPLGSGRQWFSWIHIGDLINGLVFILDRPGIEGPVNLCTPNPARNRDLARSLGKILSRPAFIPTPALAIKIVLGEFGSVLLKGQRVIPVKLKKAKFQFLFPEIHYALENLLGL